MQRIEKHIILKDKNLDDLCHKSKNLYNYVNYIYRQVFTGKLENISEYIDLVKTFKINDKEYKTISEYALITRLTKLNQVDFRALPNNISQQVIIQVAKVWKGYFKLIKSKSQKKVGLPKYKNKQGKNLIIFTVPSQCRIKGGCIYFNKYTYIKPLKTKVDNLCQVRIVPKYGYYVIEVIYKKEVKIYDNLDESLYLSIDLGINNLITTSNNADLQSFIINGKIIKSINQYFNKKKAKLMSFVGDKGHSRKIERLSLKRNNKINDYLHKSSRFVINYCIDNDIKNIIIGYNKGWKCEINIGKKNNQKFVEIPYQKLIHQIEYKAEEVGINVIIQEESYTSKCDAMVLEDICRHEIYQGKRVKRGLFQSSAGYLMNADINGAINILRKVIGDEFLTDTGVVITPYRLNC